MTSLPVVAENLKPVKILITGGAGFIGANLVNKISNIAHFKDIICVDSLESGTKNAPYLDNKAKLIRSPISELRSFSNLITSNTIVVHLAALGGVVDSVINPILNFNKNVQSTLDLLELMRQNKVNKIIFSSTGGALMGESTPPVSETSLPKPISPYGASKLSCEGYLNAYCASYGFQSVILRFGNSYGRHSLHKNGVINRWIRNIARNEPITLYGDGRTSRDFIHASDIAQGIIQSLDFVNNLSPGDCEVFHLANGEGIELAHLAAILYKLMRRRPSIQHLSHRLGEVKHNFADYSKAQNLIDFNPTMPLEEGLQDLISWSARYDPACSIR